MAEVNRGTPPKDKKPLFNLDLPWSAACITDDGRNLISWSNPISGINGETILWMEQELRGPVWLYLNLYTDRDGKMLEFMYKVCFTNETDKLKFMLRWI